MNAPTPALVARPERLRLVGQRRQILALMHQRLMFGMLLYGGIIAIIALRLIWLAAFGDHAGRKGGAIDLTPERGDIVDREGHALARTIDAWIVGLQPAKVIGNKHDLAGLVGRLPWFGPRPRHPSGEPLGAHRGVLGCSHAPRSNGLTQTMVGDKSTSQSW
jgi:cell division protein FtsI (penicillin-binding protein 3)